MISSEQILAAGLITGTGVAVSAWWLRWPFRWLSTAAIGSLVIIIAWRALSNLAQLNGDFLPAVSVGDVGCLLVGAIAPAAVAAMLRAPSQRRWTPAIVGGLVGFFVNVLIL